MKPSLWRDTMNIRILVNVNLMDPRMCLQTGVYSANEVESTIIGQEKEMVNKKK